MNGPNVMYRMRPIVNLGEQIQLPKCMYRMKNIQQAFLSRVEEQIPNKNQSSRISEQCPLPEMTALENRQEAILAQLAELKSQMAALRTQLKEQPVTDSTKANPELAGNTTKPADLLQNGVSHDILINASPKYPPYSLAAIRRLWGDGLKVGVKCHLHSSVVELPHNLDNFVSLVDSNNEKRAPLLNVTLVWKDVGPETELVVSPIKHVAIKGEVNILRYLSRLGPPQYNYELGNEPATSAKVDSLLDTCYNLARSRTKKDQQSLLRVLNGHLGKNQFLAGGKDLSIADIAAWSVLKQLEIQDLNVNMTRWHKSCSQALRL